MSCAMRSTSARSCRQVGSSFMRSLARSSALYSSLWPNSRPSSPAFWSITRPPPQARASRNRGRPNRSSCTAAPDQPYSRASARVASARRSSISTAITPPGSSSARPRASSARVAASPSAPPTSASRGSNSRTAGSRPAYSASVRYGGFDTTARRRPPASGASRSPSRTSTGTGGRTSATFSRASAAAARERSTAMTRSKSPSTARLNAMHPHPVPISATTPPFPLPSSLFPAPRAQSNTSSTSPSVSGRGISARGSSFRSSVRKLVRPAAYAKGMPLERRSTASQNRRVTSSSGSRSRRSQTSPGLTAPPATAAHRLVASRRGLASHTRSSRLTASSSSAAIEERSGTEAFLLSREAQRVDQVVEVAVQHFGKIVDGVVDAVIGDPVLGKVVRPDLGRAVAGAHLGPALAGTSRFLLGEHLVEQARAQHLERPDLVLQLALLILALHDQAGGEMGDAHGAIGGVHALAARALRAEDVDPQVFLLDLDVHLLGFGEDGDGRRGRVDATLRFSHRHALHPVHPRLVTERAVHARPPGGEDRLLQPAEVPLGEGNDFDLPALPLGKSGVHAEQLRGEQRRLVPPGAGADFHDRIAVVQRIARREQLGELVAEPLDLGAQALHIGARELRQLGVPVLEHLARLCELRFEPREAVVHLADLVEPRVLAPELPQLGRVPRGLGVGQLSGDLLRPRERLAESGLHRSAGGLVGPVFLAEPLHPPGRIHQLLPAGEVRGALGADFDVNHGHRRARHEAVAARALHGGPLIRGVNPGFQAPHP